MDEKLLHTYNQKRDELIKKYRAKKLKSSMIVIAFALAVLLVDVLFYLLHKNISVCLVIGVMAAIFSVIMVRIKIVTSNITLQKQLQYFEQDYE